MRRFLEFASLLLAIGGTTGCNHNVNLTLTSEPFTVENQCLVAGSGVTACTSPSDWNTCSATCPCQSFFTTPTAVTIDVTQNSTYNSNKSKINSVTINSVTISGVQSASNSYTDSATTLTAATVIVTDTTTNVQATYLLNPSTPIALLGSNTYSPLDTYLVPQGSSPDASGFITGAINSGDPFTIVVSPATTASIDLCPIDIDLTVAIAVELNVKLL